MKLHRIFGMVMRHLIMMKYSLERLTDTFYWPTIDLILWGVTSQFIRNNFAGADSIVLMIVSGILLWIIVWRGQYEITFGLLTEFWNRNLINIFVSPLKFWEWIVSFLVFGAIKSVMSLSFAMLMAFLLYQVKIFYLGIYFVPIMALLLMTGWWIGFLISGLILRYGRRIEAFGWTLGSLIIPFSAVYYPLSALPDWAQKISTFIPTSYIFESARQMLQTGHLDPQKLWISFGLNIVYLVLSLWYMHNSFQKVLDRGLIKAF